jgi:4-amino-4-deoxychorismate lyase
MCQLLESIKVENHVFRHLDYHQARVDAANEKLFGADAGPDLSALLHIPDFVDDQIFKCRVTCDRQIRKVEFERYTPKVIRTLKLVFDDQIRYDLKYADRDHINSLYRSRGRCDDVLIVKQGLITDTSYCNIILWDGSRWVTPEAPLLKGTKRQQLLDQGRITTGQVSVKSLGRYSKFMLINAMLDFDEVRAGSMAQIILS